MSYKITADCNNCGACEPECPNTAITSGNDIFEINAAACTECVGFYDEPRCAAVCPVDSCIPDPAHAEVEGALLEKAKKLHPAKAFADNAPSRFKH